MFVSMLLLRLLDILFLDVIFEPFESLYKSSYGCDSRGIGRVIET